MMDRMEIDDRRRRSLSPLIGAEFLSPFGAGAHIMMKWMSVTSRNC